MSRWNFHNWSSVLDSHIIDYPTPITLNYNWSFGSTAGICLVIQILSGVFLAIHYTPHVDYAFASVEHIIRDVKYGWFLRYLHANGASFFFIVVYLHIFRGLYHGSYAKPRHILWCSGVIIFILMIATAFLGYVLPWGQISFWGATVITNLFSAIPKVGKSIVMWLWGGFSVDNATLNRFFSFHYILPFVITGLVFVHLALLHENGSNNPLGTKVTNLSFYPYFYVKDLLAFFVLITALSIFVFFWSNSIGHPDNYIPADCLKTPAHIVPEWYFLPFYAILRSIPNKLGGVLAIGGALVALLLLPFLHTSNTRSATFRPYYKVGFWLWIAVFVLLTWVGQMPVDDPYVLIGQIATVMYFVLLLFGVSAIGVFENIALQYNNKNF
jgi:ubiquinol-cytochrome c reductase cytochrome b subunit